MNKEKMAFNLIKDVIDDHNLYEWGETKANRTRPDLLPRIVGVDQVLEENLEAFGAKAAHVHFKVRAKYRIYYSRRSPGARKTFHRFELGRIREGTIIFDFYTHEEDGKDYRIEFVDLKKVVET